MIHDDLPHIYDLQKQIAAALFNISGNATLALNQFKQDEPADLAQIASHVSIIERQIPALKLLLDTYEGSLDVASIKYANEVRMTVASWFKNGGNA